MLDFEFLIPTQLILEYCVNLEIIFVHRLKYFDRFRSFLKNLRKH